MSIVCRFYINIYKIASHIVVQRIAAQTPKKSKKYKVILDEIGIIPITSPIFLNKQQIKKGK